MRVHRRTILGTGLLGAASSLMTSEAAAVPPFSALRPVKVPPPPRFSPDWASLTEGYSAPDWFRDAKFEIWAHWGTASVPAAGDDWYARDMYLQGHPSYEHHLKHYGHAADTGFLEMHSLLTAAVQSSSVNCVARR
jgi:alpha-L-fucosidase